MYAHIFRKFIDFWRNLAVVGTFLPDVYITRSTALIGWWISFIISFMATRNNVVLRDEPWGVLFFVFLIVILSSLLLVYLGYFDLIFTKVSVRFTLHLFLTNKFWEKKLVAHLQENLIWWTWFTIDNRSWYSMSHKLCNYTEGKNNNTLFNSNGFKIAPLTYDAWYSKGGNLYERARC